MHVVSFAESQISVVILWCVCCYNTVRQGGSNKLSEIYTYGSVVVLATTASYTNKFHLMEYESILHFTWMIHMVHLLLSSQNGGGASHPLCACATQLFEYWPGKKMFLEHTDTQICNIVRPEEIVPAKPMALALWPQVAQYRRFDSLFCTMT